MWGATYISYPFQKTLLVPASAVCPTGYKCSFDINGNGVPCGMHFKDRKELNKHKVDAKHIKKKKADGDEEGENNKVQAADEVEAVAE